MSRILHYLDDFLVFGRPGSLECQEALQAVLEWCRKLGVPIPEQKTEGPAQVITFLGIEVDTMEYQLRLPSEKLSRLQEEIKSWTGRRSASKRDH